MPWPGLVWVSADDSMASSRRRRGDPQRAPGRAGRELAGASDPRAGM